MVPPGGGGIAPTKSDISANYLTTEREVNEEALYSPKILQTEGNLLNFEAQP
jgi:hypothetical protein